MKIFIKFVICLISVCLMWNSLPHQAYWGIMLLFVFLAYCIDETKL